MGIGDSFHRAWGRLFGSSRTCSAGSSNRAGSTEVARQRVGHEMGRRGHGQGTGTNGKAYDAPDPSLGRNPEDTTVWPSDSPRNRF